MYYFVRTVACQKQLIAAINFRKTLTIICVSTIDSFDIPARTRSACSNKAARLRAIVAEMTEIKTVRKIEQKIEKAGNRGKTRTKENPRKGRGESSLRGMLLRKYEKAWKWRATTRSRFERSEGD